MKRREFLAASAATAAGLTLGLASGSTPPAIARRARHGRLGWNDAFEAADARFALAREYFVETISADRLAAIIAAGFTPVISVRHDKTSSTAWADMAAGKLDAKVAQWHAALASVAPSRVWIAYWAEQTGYASEPGWGGRGNCGLLTEYQDAHRHVFDALSDLGHLRWANCLMHFDTVGILEGHPVLKNADVPDIPFDAYAVDTYPGTNFEEEFGPTRSLAQLRGAKPAIWETNNDMTGTAHADWIRALGAWAASNGFIHLSFFSGSGYPTMSAADRAALDDLLATDYWIA